MTRQTKDLLILLRDWCLENFHKHGCGGLCSASESMYFAGVISIEECLEVRNYISEHRPKTRYSVYAWPIFELQPRIEWLNSEIDRLTS